MIKRPTLTFISIICLTALLGACGGDTPAPSEDAPPPSAPAEQRDLKGQVTAWTLREATLSATFYGGGEANAEVAVGAIDRSGRFGVALNEVVNEVLSAPPMCDALSVSDSGARTNTFSALKVYIGDEKRGLIALASSREVVREGLRRVGDFYVQQTYADRALTLEGECDVSDALATFRYDMTLRRGWNTVLFTLTAKSEEGEQTLSLSTRPVPERAAWFFREGR